MPWDACIALTGRAFYFEHINLTEVGGNATNRIGTMRWCWMTSCLTGPRCVCVCVCARASVRPPASARSSVSVFLRVCQYLSVRVYVYLCLRGRVGALARAYVRACMYVSVVSAVRPSCPQRVWIIRVAFSQHLCIMREFPSQVPLTLSWHAHMHLHARTRTHAGSWRRQQRARWVHSLVLGAFAHECPAEPHQRRVL